MQAIETKRRQGSVTSLDERRLRVRGVEQELEPQRTGGRMWINGREVGGPAARFEHLETTPG